MKVFENIKELEEIYLKLINEAKERHTKEFRSIKEKYDEKIDKKTNALNEFIDTNLKNLLSELKKQTISYQEITSELLKNIDHEYEGSKEDYIKQLIKILELPF